MNKLYRNAAVTAILFSMIFQSVSFAEDTVETVISEEASTKTNAETPKTTIIMNGFKSESEQPVEKDGKTFVAINDVLSTGAGVQLEWSELSKTLNIMKGTQLYMQIMPDKNYIFFEGKRVNTNYTPYIQNGKVMFPLEELSKYFDFEKFNYDKDKNIVTIETDQSLDAKLQAEKREGTPLTLDDAIEKALNVDSSLINVKEGETLSKKTRDELAQKLLLANNNGTIDPILQLMSADKALETIPYQIEAAKTAVRTSIRRSFNTILGYELDLAFQRQSIEHQKILLDVAKKKVELGMMAQFDYNQQELKYNQAVQNIKTLETSIDTEYSNLGIMIDSNTKYVIDYDVTKYDPIGEVDVVVYANRRSYDSPSIKIQEIDLDQQEQQLKRTSAGSEYDKAQNSYNQSKRKLADSKDQIETTVRSTYQSIKESEVKYNQALQDLNRLREELEVLKVQYNVGSASGLDIENKNFELLSKEYEIKKTIIALDNAKYQFENIQ